MTKIETKSVLFRSIPVHRKNVDSFSDFFRSMSVHFYGKSALFPEHTRSPFFNGKVDEKPVSAFFWTKPVHFCCIFDYLCAGNKTKTSTSMAGTIKEMSLIKQVLQLKQQGESNRGIARKLPINKETVNGYLRTISENGWDIDELLEMDDPVLDYKFHAGSPAYADERMQVFLDNLPYYREQLTNKKLHVNRQLLYEEYKAKYPNGYGKSQFYYHLKQNLVAQKDVTAVLAGTYKPGEKLMVDFAGDKLSYVDLDTGEVIKVETFVACLPYSDYTYAICVPSQKTEDFIYAIRMCLEHLGGVPPILTPDNLKSAVIKPDRHEPKLNRALEDMGNHYHFVVLPCDPAQPTQKALVEDAVRKIYYRIYAKLRNRTFHTLTELNEAVWEQLALYNQTRMQKRPYSREERFHAVEKALLKPLPEEIFEMRYYANLHVGENCFVELTHNKITRYYSAPYIHVGKPAKVIFTRSWVKIYVDGMCVATHQRAFCYGHTFVDEHLASKCNVIMKRSASTYVERARRMSPTCMEYISNIFSPQRTNQPEEVYYRLCEGIFSLYRNYGTELTDMTCRQCMDHDVYSYKRFEYILKRNKKGIEETHDDPPVPTDHANMRGRSYFM